MRSWDATLSKSTVIVCEGHSDAQFFRALTGQFPGFSHVEVRCVQRLTDNCVQGNSGFGRALRALRGTKGFESVTNVVIVTDNDADKAGSFERVALQIKELSEETGKPPDQRDFPVPEAIGARYGADPALSVLLIPTDQDDGGLETLLYEAAAQVSHANAAAVEILAGTTGVTNWAPQKQAKMRLISLLACTHQQRPDVPIANIWSAGSSAELVPLGSPAFLRLVNDLRALV